jgi:hypothetical protein
MGFAGSCDHRHDMHCVILTSYCIEVVVVVVITVSIIIIISTDVLFVLLICSLFNDASLETKII